MTAQAASFLAVRPHLLQLFHLRRGQIPVQFPVLTIIEQQAQSFATIPSGPSCFLIITFQVQRQVVMNDKRYIAFVYAHTKSIGGNHDPDLVPDKLIPGPGPFFRGQTSMVACSSKTVFLQEKRYLLRQSPGSAVHDTAFPPAWFQ